METAQQISELDNEEFTPIENRNPSDTISFPNLKPIAYSVLGFSSIVYYLRFGAPLVTEYYFNGTVGQNFDLAVCGLLGILTLTAVGCSVHIRLLGGFEKNELEKEIKRELVKLTKTYNLANSLTKQVETEIYQQSVALTTRGGESLRKLKRVLVALDNRIRIVSNLSASGKMPDLCEAVGVLRKKLKSNESAQLNLIDVDPFQAIAADQIESVIFSLSKDLQEVKRKAA